MTTLLLADRSNPGCVLLKPGRARTRLKTYLRSRPLDQALASGASPDSSAELSLRARWLIGAPARTTLARSIRTLIEDAQRPAKPLSPGVPVCRRKVLGSARTLELLTERLTSGGPVDARGVAQVRVLLNDVRGPVYDRAAANDLEPALQEAIEALEVTT